MLSLMSDAMTSTIPRRFFDETDQMQIDDNSGRSAELREQGLIRVHGIISIELNSRIKAAARRQGMHADQFMGQLITNAAAEVEKVEAQQEVARLRERFGDDWINILKQAN